LAALSDRNPRMSAIEQPEKSIFREDFAGLFANRRF
jgi:hypothetical protein